MFKRQSIKKSPNDLFLLISLFYKKLADDKNNGPPNPPAFNEVGG